MARIKVISGEFSPYRCNGGLGIAVENLCLQLAMLGIDVEVFFPFLGDFTRSENHPKQIIPHPVPSNLDVSLSDSDLAPVIEVFCGQVLSLINSNNTSCFIINDNETAISVIGASKLNIPTIFWIHSLYDHPTRADFCSDSKKAMISESLLASAVVNADMVVASRGLIDDARSVQWPSRFRDLQLAIKDASDNDRIIFVESLGCLPDFSSVTTANHVAEKYGYGNRPFVLFPSRPVLSKGIGFYSEIAKMMSKYDLDFLAVGDPTKETISRCDNIHWIPWLNKEDLFGLMKESIAVLHPSLSEGYGLAAAESTYLNENVFCHSVGGLRILTDRGIAKGIQMTSVELEMLYNLWSDLLSSESESPWFIWDDYVDHFKGLLENWETSLVALVGSEHQNTRIQQKIKEVDKWKHQNWGEAIHQDMVRRKLY